MRVLLFALLVIAVVYGQSSTTADWHGTWTANDRYGGVTYLCPVGNRVYGVYSQAGFLEGNFTTPDKRTIEGNYFEGGRDDRNDWQGSFRIVLSEDNQSFDGFWTRVTEDGKERRWHETRLGAPHPSNPTNEQCMVPWPGQRITGVYFRDAERSGVNAPGEYHICKSVYSQVYGSFDEPNGFLEGWSVRDTNGFHGYRYTNDGHGGAYILRATSPNEVRGFYWRGRLAEQNRGLVREEVLVRSEFTAAIEQCEANGPGFLRRLRGERNSATSTTLSVFAVLFAFVVVVLF
eukprot:TRINITY_DN44301_c0_g1_i1.p1 TRINITY_DN44301_c0_g1~~TRINITY_DN44301_c0_g1_i1.p1  ORF type:complete len:290 (+),score=93.70 TRINITY_DN44301_c0_g1_i1:223-1092(+)